MNKSKNNYLYVVTWPFPTASDISKIWWNLIIGFLKGLVTKIHWQCIKMVGILQSSVGLPNFLFSGLIPLCIYLLVHGIPLSNYVFPKLVMLLPSALFKIHSVQKCNCMMSPLGSSSPFESCFDVERHMQMVQTSNFRSSTCNSKFSYLRIIKSRLETSFYHFCHFKSSVQGTEDGLMFSNLALLLWSNFF